MMKNNQNLAKSIFLNCLGFSIFCLAVLIVLSFASDLMAQSAIGVIEDAIRKMVMILNVIIVGILAWTGFLLARGDGSAFQRMIYCVIGLIVVNSASAILDFFY